MNRDPGAQPERTRLSWRRTVLSATVLLLLIVRQIVGDGVSAFNAVMLAASALAWLAMLIGAQRRITALSAARPAMLAAPWPAVFGAAGMALIAIAVATVVQ